MDKLNRDTKNLLLDYRVGTKKGWKNKFNKTVDYIDNGEFIEIDSVKMSDVFENANPLMDMFCNVSVSMNKKCDKFLKD